MKDRLEKTGNAPMAYLAKRLLIVALTAFSVTLLFYLPTLIAFFLKAA